MRRPRVARAAARCYVARRSEDARLLNQVRRHAARRHVQSPENAMLSRRCYAHHAWRYAAFLLARQQMPQPLMPFICPPPRDAAIRYRTAAGAMLPI